MRACSHSYVHENLGTHSDVLRTDERTSDQLSLVGASVWLMGMVTCGLVRCWRRTPLWSDVDSPLR